MTTPWGNDDRGPEGQQSWLGGSGRDGHEVVPGGRQGGASGGTQGGGGSSGGWSSDFAADSGSTSGSDRGDAGQGRSADPAGSSAPEYQGPQFGNGGGQSGGNDAGWSSEFPGAGGSSEKNSSGNGGGYGKVSSVLGVIVSIVVLVVFVVIAYRSGMQLWWAVFFVGIPLVRRVVRLLGRGTRR